MATTAQLEQITKIYIGYFNRAPDPAGLNYWAGRLDAGMSLAAIATSFSVQPESTTKYPYLANPNIASSADFLNAVYMNLFNRAIDAEGSTYWAAQLAAGKPVGQMIQDIISGAQGADATIVTNKTSVGLDFALKTANIPGFVYDANAAAAAVEVINGVNATDASVVAGKAETTAYVATAGSNPGVSLSLTAGADNLTGGSANDTFSGVVSAVAAENTINAGDKINGGAGSDTLSVTATNAGDVLGGALFTSIETVSVRSIGVASTLDASQVVGLTAANSAVSTGTLAVTNLAAGASIGSIGNGVVANGAVTGTYVAGATAATINVSAGTTAGALTVVGAGLASTTINSTGVANTVGAVDVAASKTVTINAATNLTTGGIATTGTTATINVSGIAASVGLGTLDTDVTTVNAAGLTAGGITATMSATATTAITGGAGNDTITTGVVLTTGSVAAGGGAADKLIVADSTHVASAALAGKYTGFEALQVNNGVTQDASLLAGITSVAINGGAAATGLTNLSAAQAGAVTIVGAGAGVITVGVKDATTPGQIDTVKIDVNDGAAAVNTIALGTPVLTGVEKLEITATDNVTIAALTSASSLDSIVLKGAGTIGITTGAVSTINAHIDGSAATGVVTIDASAYATNGIKITGGSANDVLTGSAQADTILGGAGNDTITGGDGTDTLTGGLGADTFAFAAGANAGADGAAVADVITDFVAGTDKLQFTGLVDVVSAQQAAVQAAVTALAGGSTDAQIATAMAAANTTNLGVSMAVFNGNTYVYFETTGATATHVEADNLFVKLTGVTTLPTFAADVVA